MCYQIPRGIGPRTFSCTEYKLRVGYWPSNVITSSHFDLVECAGFELAQGVGTHWAVFVILHCYYSEVSLWGTDVVSTIKNRNLEVEKGTYITTDSNILVRVFAFLLSTIYIQVWSASTVWLKGAACIRSVSDKLHIRSLKFGQME